MITLITTHHEGELEGFASILRTFLSLIIRYPLFVIRYPCLDVYATIASYSCNSLAHKEPRFDEILRRGKKHEMSGMKGCMCNACLVFRQYRRIAVAGNCSMLAGHGFRIPI